MPLLIEPDRHFFSIFLSGSNHVDNDKNQMDWLVERYIQI